MRRFNRKTQLVGWLIALALIGLAITQIVLLRQAFTSERGAFERSAVVALSKASLALTSDEILQVIVSSSLDSIDPHALSVPPGMPHTGIGLFRSEERTIFTLDSIEEQQYQFQIVGDSLTCELELNSDRMIRSIFVKQEDTVIVGTDTTFTTRVDTFGMEPGQMAHIDVRSFDNNVDSARIMLVQSTVDRLLQRDVLPVSERLSLPLIDSLVSEALTAEGITLDYQVGVVDRMTDTLIVADTNGNVNELIASPYRTGLFPYDRLSRPADLVAVFPDRTRYLWTRMLPVAIPTGVFLLLVGAGLWYVLRLLVGQQRFSEQLVGFINNMTHEFKTPISTIQLASEAIARGDVQTDSEKLTRFNRMIQEENSRMKLQVEKILQMAVIEDGAIEMSREPVDIHAILSGAIASARLVVTGQSGSLEHYLWAERPVVLGDAVHLGNVFRSLLDNACKYSGDSPVIRVETENVNGSLHVRITDRGIGIAPEDLKHVCDRYYRVTTGDRHDAKGFGLGLSYVKLIVESLGGSLTLKSALGKGTEVLVSLPICNEQVEN